MNNSDAPTSPVPIQTEIGISIEFNMGVVPIDNTGCYVKYTFPKDMPLTSEVYGYLGYDMMAKDDGEANLRPKLEYWT